MNVGLQRRIELMEKSPPIDIANVDFSFGQLEIAAPLIGPIARYFGRVEGSVGGHDGGYVEQLQAMLQEAKDPDSDIGMFLPHWQIHELAHGETFEEAQRLLGLEPSSDFPIELPLGARLVGRVTDRFAAAERIVKGVYLAHGARHERLTKTGYDAFGKLLIKHDMTGFEATAIKPIQRQESLHLGWYTLAFQEHLNRLAEREIRIVQRLEAMLYWPVGAKTKKYRSEFGRLTLKLLDGEPLESFSDPIQDIVDRMYDNVRAGGTTVIDRIEKCVDAAEREFALAA